VDDENKNTPFMNLSLLYLENIRAWEYIFFLGPLCAHFFLFFFNTWTFMWPYFKSPCPFCNNTGERDQYTWSFISMDGWKGVANFQCRSLACGVYVILIKQV
jgi:hypothetical protein